MVNVSEGRDQATVETVATAAGHLLLDQHLDPSHHRSVLTIAGAPGDVEEAVRGVARSAVGTLDLTDHRGVHPRLGVLDVVPFVDLAGAATSDAGPTPAAIAARDRFARWAGAELGLPCFLYGPDRPLPEVRRRAWHDLDPDTGPPEPHPSAGGCAVGARGLLVAYNLWLTGPLEEARRIARELRGPEVRALGLQVEGAVQVSCNLVQPTVVGPAELYDRVVDLTRSTGRAEVLRAELVGLIPGAVLGAVPPGRRSQLDLAPERTIEARLERAGS